MKVRPEKGSGRTEIVGLTDEILGMLLSTTKMMESSKQHPDRIVIENGALTMYFSNRSKTCWEKNIQINKQNHQKNLQDKKEYSEFWTYRMWTPRQRPLYLRSQKTSTEENQNE